eukprot:157796_1
MSITNTKNQAFSKFTDELYLSVFAEKKDIWSTSVDSFRELKWAVRQHHQVLSATNTKEIVRKIKGFGDVYSNMINEYWLSPNNYAYLITKIVNKKLNDTDIANKKMNDRNTSTITHQEPKSKTKKKKQKKKKKKKKTTKNKIHKNKTKKY